MMDDDRLKHSIAVARKMVELGKKRNLSEEELHDLFLLGLVHDIGYEFGDGDTHNKVGFDILNDSTYKYGLEVLYHGKNQDEYSSLYLDILNEADMSIDKYGNDVGYDARLEDIKSRYGEDSVAYKNSYQIVKKIKNR